jgi:hypothetical protein
MEADVVRILYDVEITSLREVDQISATSSTDIRNNVRRNNRR